MRRRYMRTMRWCRSCIGAVLSVNKRIAIGAGLHDCAVPINIFITDDLYDGIGVSILFQLDHGDVLAFFVRYDILQNENMGIALLFCNDLYIIYLAVTIEIEIIDAIVLAVDQLFQLFGTTGLFKHFECTLQAEVITGKSGRIGLIVLGL